MALNVIGESGVRIRPVTSGFVPELEAYINNTAGRVAAEIPLAIGSVQLQGVIDDLKSSAAGGAVLPIELARSGVDAGLADIRKTAQAGADFALRADTSRVSSSLDDAQNSATQFGNQFGGVIDRLNGQIAGLGEGVQGLGRKLVNLLSSPGGALIGGGAIAGAFGFANVLSAGNQRLTRIEDSTAALEIQLGGTKQAADLVADILKTVQGTPFTLDQFIEAGRTLVTFGTAAEKIPTYLTAIGEAAAGSGQGIEAVGTITDVFSKIQIAGRATTDDWQRLGFVGVNALKIWGNAAGKTTAEMQQLVTDGAVPAEDAINQLIEGITNGSDGVAGKVNRLGGSMEKLRNTFSGAAGGLQAASARFGVALLDPFRESTVKLIQNATDALDTLAPVVRELLDQVADSKLLKDFVKSIAEIPTKLGPAIRIISELVRQAIRTTEVLIEGIKPVATIFGGALLASMAGFIRLLTNLFGLMERNAGVTKALAATLTSVFLVSKVTGWVSAMLGAIRRTTVFATAQAAVRAAAAGTNTELARQIILNNQLAISQGRSSVAAIGGATASAAETGIGITDVISSADSATSLASAAASAGDAARNVNGIGLAATESTGRVARMVAGLKNGANVIGQAIFTLVGGWTGIILGSLVAVGLGAKYFYDTFKKQAADAAKIKVEPLGDIRKDAQNYGERLSNQKKFNEEYARLIESTKPENQVNLEVDGSVGLFAGLAGIPGADALQSIIDLTPGLNGFGQAVDFVTNKTIDLTIAENAKATASAARTELRQQTAGYGRLASAIRSAEVEFGQLGLARETDAKKVAEQRKVLTEALTNSIDPKLKGQEYDDAVAKAAVNANTLAQFSAESLTIVQNALGLSMEEIASMSAPELAQAVRDAAAATAEAQAAAVGLSKGMAEVAQAYDNAKKAAEAYLSIAFAQQNSWLQGQVAADNYQQALGALQFSTDFTASNLQNVSQAMQAQIGAAYEAATAQATLSGSTDVTGDAAKAAAVEEAKLRDSFIEAAIGAGKTREEAENLATAFAGIPGSKTISIQIIVQDAELKAAEERLALIKAAYESAPFVVRPGAVGAAQTDVNRERNESALLRFYEGLAFQEQQRAQQAAQDEINSTEAQQAAQRAREDADRAAQEATREATRAAEEAAREAERLAEEAKRQREKELQDFLRTMEGIRNASQTMITSFEKLIDSFREKRRELIGDITKRVDFGTSTSVARLIKNADQRNAALTESQKGLGDLRKRGLSEDAVRSIGLTGKAEDARAIRRLLRASPEELKALSASVGKLGETATQAAYREQGEIIGREVRNVLEAWVETPGVQKPNVTIAEIVKLIRDSRGDSEKAASRISERLGGTVKR